MPSAAETSPEIPLFDLLLRPEDLEVVAETLRSGWLTMGPRTAAFEEAFAAQLGCEHAVCVSSCTSALHLAYHAAGVGPGDEVIVPSITFVATAAAAVYCGATPVFAEIIGQHDLSIDPEDVARRITPRTKAVCAVHFAGYAARIEELRDLCDAHGVALIEDVAHAPSARARSGGKLGTFGLAAAFSFFSNKVLSAGEGGLLATDDEDVAAQARLLRSHGMTSGTWARHTGLTDTYDVGALGYNYRLDEPRAALLLSRLGSLEQDIARRRELVRAYRERLTGIDGLTVPYEDADIESSCCYVMPIMLEDAERRGPFRGFLREERGVQTSVFYPAIHEFTAYRERYGEQSLPRSELAARTEVTIPLFPHMTEGELNQVVTAIEDGLAR